MQRGAAAPNEPNQDIKELIIKYLKQLNFFLEAITSHPKKRPQAHAIDRCHQKANS